MKEKNSAKININWYPGHMTKARRALEDKLKQIDIVAEVLDARAPLYTKNPDFDDLFAPKGRYGGSGGNKGMGAVF